MSQLFRDVYRDFEMSTGISKEVPLFRNEHPSFGSREFLWAHRGWWTTPPIPKCRHVYVCHLWISIYLHGWVRLLTYRSMVLKDRHWIRTFHAQTISSEDWYNAYQMMFASFSSLFLSRFSPVKSYFGLANSLTSSHFEFTSMTAEL
jgi:hypothetical protein